VSLGDLPHAFVLAGVAVTAVVARWRARRNGLPVQIAIDGLFVMVASGLVTGHLADVLLYRWPAFRRDWTEILPWSGGWCSLGAIVGGALAGLLWFRRRDPGRFLSHADNLAVALALGWAVGRLGCVVAHDHLSAPATSPLVLPGGPSHDLGLYEALLSFGLFLVLACLDRGRRWPGLLLATAALMFGGGRFALEMWREDPRLGGLTAVQYVMIAVAGYGAWMLARVSARSTDHRRRRASPVAVSSTPTGRLSNENHISFDIV
jgi:phosphatidylglycerol---prolipoprotein diacylglyceryl transferase